MNYTYFIILYIIILKNYTYNFFQAYYIMVNTMSNLIQFFKDNIKTIFITIIIYQIILTIFTFTTANLIILACLIVGFASFVVINNYKDDIKSFFKK